MQSRISQPLSGEERILKLEERCDKLEQQMSSFFSEHNVSSLPQASRLIRTLKGERDEYAKMVEERDKIIEDKESIIKKQKKTIKEKEEIINSRQKKIENLKNMIEEITGNMSVFFKNENVEKFERLVSEFKVVCEKLNLETKSEDDLPEFSELGLTEKKFFDTFCKLVFFSNIYVRYYSSRLDNTMINSPEQIKSSNEKTMLDLEKIYFSTNETTIRRDLHDGTVLFNKVTDRIFFNECKKDLDKMEYMILPKIEKQRCIIL